VDWQYLQLLSRPDVVRMLQRFLTPCAIELYCNRTGKKWVWVDESEIFWIMVRVMIMNFHRPFNVENWSQS
jgi:hypothetical protein